MKKKLLILFVLISMNNLIYSQIDAFSYQAIIKAPISGQTGVDQGSLFGNVDVNVRFTIIENDVRIYQEIHETSTDEFSMVNLNIGQGDIVTINEFSDIFWDGTPKDLKVELNFDGEDWKTISQQPLLFVPYAYHRDIIANGWLTVSGTTTLDDSLTVAMNSPTHLTGNLQVDQTFEVDGITTLNNNVTVTNNAKTTLTGNLQVDQNLVVTGTTTINDKTVFDIQVIGQTDDEALESYPVVIKGSKQGLAIIVSEANTNPARSDRGNNYISFWKDNGETMTGRVEGMGKGDLINISTMVGSITDFVKNAFVETIEGVIGGIPTVSELGDEALNQITSLIVMDAGAPPVPELTGGDLPSADLDLGSLPSLSGNLTDGFSLNSGSLPSLDFDEGSFPSLNISDGELPSVEFNIPQIPDVTDPLSLPIASDVISFGLNRIDGVANVIGDIHGTFQSTWVNDPEIATILFSDYMLDEIQMSIDLLTGVISLVIELGDPNASVSAKFNTISSFYGILASHGLYEFYTFQNLGCAFESGAGDYAEWLLRSDPNEFIQYGDVVGVIGGKISKKYVAADNFMVISTSPILLGNMPENIEEQKLSEKVAFMGQVPVKTIGKVKVGDYLLPSGCGDGFAIGVNPENMRTKDYQRIIGVAWENSKPGVNTNMINIAVGINHNDMSKKVEQMQFTLNHIQETLAKLDPEYVAHIYDVDMNSFNVVSPEYTVAPGHISNRMETLNSKTSTDEQFLVEARKMIKEAGYGLSDMSIVEAIIENLDNSEYALGRIHQLRAGLLAKQEYLLANNN